MGKHPSQKNQPPAEPAAKKPKRHPWRTYDCGFFAARVSDHRSLPNYAFRVIHANGRPR